MQGTEEKGLTTKIELNGYKKIIGFPAKYLKNKSMQVIKKNNSKNKIIILRKRNMVNVSKKIFLSKNKPHLNVVCQKENLISLIILRRNKFNCLKIKYSVRTYWASNSPRYSIK